MISLLISLFSRAKLSPLLFAFAGTSAHCPQCLKLIFTFKRDIKADEPAFEADQMAGDYPEDLKSMCCSACNQPLNKYNLIFKKSQSMKELFRS